MSNKHKRFCIKFCLEKLEILTGIKFHGLLDDHILHAFIFASLPKKLQDYLLLLLFNFGDFHLL